MKQDKATQIIKELFKKADITINGKKKYDIRINNNQTATRILKDGVLGFGESYSEGWWDALNLDETLYKIIKTDLDKSVMLSYLPQLIRYKFLNPQSKKRAFQVGAHHYDIGNDLYVAMLDKTMAYSCGYWRNARTLHQAQLAKLDLICKKLHLKKGETLLDIGCGWGSLMEFATKKYKVKCTGITVSKEQKKLAQKRCPTAKIKVMDYRDLNSKFDKIASVGMFEHVGSKNYNIFFKIAKENLKEKGLFLLHSIGSDKKDTEMNPWIEKYIFPNGQIPSAKQITSALEGKFIIEDWHNFGSDYDKTLMAWFHNFDRAYPKMRKTYNEYFYRMWKFYLLSCAAAFRARSIQLWQIVLSRDGVVGGYRSIR